MSNREKKDVSRRNNSTDDPENSKGSAIPSAQTLRSWLLIGGGAFLVSVLLIAIARVIPNVIFGRSNEATTASVLTSIATLLLVLITWKYVDETRTLVKLTRKQSRIREKERKERTHSFRTALYDEISTEQDWDQFRRLLISHESITQPVPTQVYETTPWRVGQLTEEERVPIVKYYTSVFNLRQLIEQMPSNELTSDKGGLIQPIEDQITFINELQDQALKAIDRNLDDSY